MITGQFTSQILAYLEQEQKTLSESLLAEASKRCQNAFRRQLMEEREQSKILRLSSGGQCVRKQWYSYHGHPQEALSGRTMNTFLTGDLLEVSLSVLGRLAGWQLMGKDGPEEEVVVAGIKGHIDDLLYVPDEKKYYVIEYKTMSEYSYRKFEKEGLDDAWGYLTQGSLYCEAVGCDAFILVAQCKNTGHICDQVVPKNNDLIQKAKDRWERILNNGEMPDREYQPEPETKYNRSTKVYDPTGRAILGINCSYCAFKAMCWPEAQQDFKGEKPIWIVPQKLEMSV